MIRFELAKNDMKPTWINNVIRKGQKQSLHYKFKDKCGIQYSYKPLRYFK